MRSAIFCFCFYFSTKSPVVPVSIQVYCKSRDAFCCWLSLAFLRLTSSASPSSSSSLQKYAVEGRRGHMAAPLYRRQLSCSLSCNNQARHKTAPSGFGDLLHVMTAFGLNSENSPKHNTPGINTAIGAGENSHHVFR